MILSQDFVGLYPLSVSSNSLDRIVSQGPSGEAGCSNHSLILTGSLRTAPARSNVPSPTNKSLPAHWTRLPTANDAHLDVKYNTSNYFCSLRADSFGNSSLQNIDDIRYAVTTTINGRNFTLMVDTGSADIFVIDPLDGTFPQYNTTGSQNIILGYAGGLVYGVTGFATVSVGGYTVPSQAIAVTNASAVGLGDLASLGLDGFFGVSPDVATKYDGSFLVAKLGLVGQPFVYNLFDQMPQQNNFLAMSLSRAADLEDSAEASFTINTLDPRYALAANAARPQRVFPGLDVNGRWSVIVDAIHVGNTKLELTSVVPGTPAGKMVADIDSGTPTAELPVALWYALFSNIPNATIGLYEGRPVMVIPCNTTTLVTVVIGGVKFPIHPLDLSLITPGPLANTTLGDNTVCFAMAVAGAGDPGDIDAIFGDSLMRNFYSVFNFGNAIAHSPGVHNASIQFVPLTDGASAQQDVSAVRMAQFANGTYPAELTIPLGGFEPALPGKPPAWLNISSPTGSSEDTSGSALAGESFFKGVNGAALATSGDATSESTGTPSAYTYAILGLLGANLVLVFGLLVLGIVTYRRTAGRTREAQYRPVRLPKTEFEAGEDGRYQD
uniref:Acid protease n=1 Tax=Mycena chlorophos TaxID=658473 RepID=A0ABQ0L4A6_MYCCL|nr:acid protease [Mycena chlorophos]